MVCYVIWLFVKRPSQETIQRRSQRDRLVKIKVFKLYGETQMISPVTSHSEVQEESHSIVQDPPGPSLQHWRSWAKQCTEARGDTNFNSQLNQTCRPTCRCSSYLYCHYSNLKLLVLISTVYLNGCLNKRKHCQTVRGHPFMTSTKNKLFDPVPLSTCVHMGRTPLSPFVDVHTRST